MDDGVCARLGCCLQVPFDPDVYSAALSASAARGASLTDGEVAAFLTTCLMLSLVAFVASAALMRLAPVAELLRQSLYGPYADLVREAAAAASSDAGRRDAPPERRSRRASMSRPTS